ncbi:MAG: FtsX-like permease family protein [Acidobacteria bacterium]|nr:FtsX-like permease family protein [Acidobacteriota bacterium]
MRSRIESGVLASLLRDEVLALDANLPLYRVQTMARVMDDAQWNGRVSSMLLSVLTCIALGLSTIGLYAVTAHGVSRRTREIGLRMALGAQPHQVRRLVLRRAMAQLALGFVAGVVCTVGWDRMFSSGRAEVRMTDPPSLAIVAAVLIVVATLACLVPIRRATRVDPVAAIRHE